MQTMILTAPPAFPRLNVTATVLSWLDRIRSPGYLRNMVFAGCLSLFTAVLYADELQQSWLPDDLQLPADMDVLTDRSIGSSLRMFSFTTERDVDALFTEWNEALKLAGYTMHQVGEENLGHVIEFSGPDIINAKITVAPMADQGRSVIEVDGTLK